MLRGLMGVLGGAVALCAAAAPASATVNMCNVPIPVSDGKVMYANVSLPGDGSGKYPTALTLTGYNKDVGNPTGGRCAPASQAFVDAGYASVIIDDRGTGASQGGWDVWSARTQKDYEEELDWLREQAWSNGKAGVYGGSYLGITSLLAAQADQRRVDAGKPRVIEAVWADIPMADAYRDVTFHGGAIDSGFIPLWLGLVNALSAPPPSNTTSDPAGGIPTWAEHLTTTGRFTAERIATATLGMDTAYDSEWYRTRSPVEKIDTLTIPVAWTGGWWDIFQRGEPLLFERMVNSPQRKFWMTPNYHSAPDAAAWAQQEIGSHGEVMRRWFDRWVKGEPNDVESLPAVNLFTMGRDRWQHAAQWPLPGTRYTRFHLDEGATMGTGDAEEGGDSKLMLPASSPCSRLTAQWTAGAGALGPCETDNREYERTALTYTTSALTRSTEVTGPIVANVWAELTSKDATLVAVLSDVAPTGESTQVTAGFLLASQRATDPDKSDRNGEGEIIRPYHPFTVESQKPVEPGKPSLYRIEIYPTSHEFAKGHRMRLTINSANTPSTATPVPAVANSAGGVITVLRGGEHASHVLLPLQPEASKAAKRRTKKKRRRRQ